MDQFMEMDKKDDDLPVEDFMNEVYGDEMDENSN